MDPTGSTAMAAGSASDARGANLDLRARIDLC